MGTTVRQIRRYVQKIAKKAGLSPEETKLAVECVVGICKSGSCHVSEIVRALKHQKPFRKETREFYDQLADPKAELESLRDAWLEIVAPVANKMPFIAVDPSDIVKRYGQDFDNLGTVRDASDPDKPMRSGFSTVQIEATNHGQKMAGVSLGCLATKAARTRMMPDPSSVTWPPMHIWSPTW